MILLQIPLQTAFMSLIDVVDQRLFSSTWLKLNYTSGIA